MCNHPGKDFEQEVILLAKLMGHKIIRKPKPGPDGGVDAITELKNMPFGGGKYVIQCKNIPNKKIGREVVDQLIGTLEREGIPTGIIVTSGSFAKAAKTAAKKTGRVELIDRKQLDAIRKRLTSPYELTLAWARRTKDKDWYIGD